AARRKLHRSVVELDPMVVHAELTLPGRPRWALYDREQDVVYANIQQPAQIVVIDCERTVIERALEVSSAGPHGLWLDSGRLFCAADGGDLVALERDSGEVIASLPLPGVPDVVMHDPELERLYVAIGEPGLVCSFDTERLEQLESVETEQGAHTSCWDPLSQCLYVFCPRSGGAAVYGSVFALTGGLPGLVLVARTGTVSTDVVESGPFTSLEQAMLPHAGSASTRLFGTYNTVATLAGSLGALLALAGSSPRSLLVYPLAAAAGLFAAGRLSPTVERGEELEAEPLPPLHRSRGIVMRLSALFALDSFGGGFVPQTFIAYLFVRKYGASPHTLAIVFFAIGILQAISFQGAVRLAGRIGLLRTMVFTHLPSNLLLAAVAFAPNLATAIVLLLCRFALSQMDVPTRQAYVMAVVDPSERTAAAAYTNTARYL